MIKHLLLATLLGVFILLGYVAYHVGYFKPVTIREVGLKEFVLIGLRHDGAYHKIVEKIQRVEAKIKWLGGNCEESFGLYIDNPAEVEQDRLRSFGGCIVKDPVWMRTHLDSMKDFQVAEWKADLLIEAYFEGSPGIGPFSVYPKVADYVASRQLKPQKSVIEVYLMKNEKEMVTYYYFPLEGLQSSLF